MIVFQNLKSPAVEFSMNLDGVIRVFQLRYQHTSDSWFFTMLKNGEVVASVKIVKGFPLFSAHRAAVEIYGDIFCLPNSANANIAENVGWDALNDDEFSIVYLSDDEIKELSA